MEKYKNKGEISHMDRIDFKSLIIGILGTIICIITMGSNKQKFVTDEIICKKFIIINDKNKERIILTSNKNGGKFQIMNNYGELSNSIGISDNDNGYFSIYNNYGSPTFSAGTGSNGNGIIKTFNKDGNLRTYIGSSDNGGLFNIYNNWDVQVGYFGTNKKQEGYIKLSDNYGEKGWIQSAIKK
tara:strand:- start:459 stop:1010 length:552 start_codon:yes stop_codon:yes gene_type:complete